MAKEEKPLKLSPSKLNTFLACKRCFWLEMHGEAPPQGPFTGVLTILDSMQKNYYDRYRKNGLPPLLKGKLKLRLADQKLVDTVRKYLIWNDSKTGDILRGKMDDCFVDKAGRLVVMDNKTRSGEFKEIYDEYRMQLDTYAFLLQKNGFNVGKTGYIVYFVPDRKSKIEKGVKFKVDARPVKLRPGRVVRTFREALRTARLSSPPKRHKDEFCEMCTWFAEVTGL
jgi:CRISPR/Cas system-associated exonuclease Cas4 (RecB family)